MLLPRCLLSDCLAAFSTRGYWLLCSFMLLYGAGFAEAQVASSTLQRINRTTGLPDNTVYDLHFDEQGWMWIATSAGLYRYDGIDFIPYRSSQARHIETHSIQPGPDGALYVANFRKQIFQVRGDSLALVIDLGTDWSDFATYSALADGLYVLVDQHLFRQSYGDSVLHEIALPSFGKQGLERKLVTVDAHAALVTEQWQPAGILSGGKTQRLPVTYPGHLMCVLDMGTHALALIAQDSGTLSWTTVHPSRAGVARITVDPAPSSAHRAAVEHDDGTFYVGGSRGLFAYAPGSEWTHVIRNVDVSALAHAANGQLWIATLDQGLIGLTEAPADHKAYDELSAGLVGLVVDEAGTLYGSTRTYDLYALGESARRCERNVASYTFWRDATGRPCLGDQYLTTVGDCASLRPLGPARINQLKAAAQRADGSYAYASISGLYQARHEEVEDQVTQVRGVRSYDLAAEQDPDRLWVAYADSLVVYEAGQAQAISDPLLATTPTTVDLLPPAHLLVGTSGDGLQYGTTASVLAGERLTNVPSLEGSSVRIVHFDGERVWVATELGLNRCVLAASGALQCTRIGQRYGMPDEAPTAMTSQAGELIVAYDRIVKRLPIDVQELPQYSQVRATFVKTEVSGKIVSTHPDVGPVSVRANADAVALTPRAPYYPADNLLQFRYRVSTIDTNWRVVAGTQPEIYLASVPPGEHLVELALDVPGALRSSLVIDSRLVWWQRRGLQWGVGALSVALLGLILWRRFARETRELRLRAELRRSRLTAISAQMNPHFIFNALNSIQEFILDQDPKLANAYLGRFAQLMRLTLDHSSAAQVPLRDEVEAMRLYMELEQLRSDRTIRATLEVDPALSLTAHLPPLLVQPYIENAFKHGLLDTSQPNRELLVHYSSAGPGFLEVTVSDNGIGRAAAAHLQANRPRRGFAMSATAQRIDLLNEANPEWVTYSVDDLVDARGQAAGTRIRLRIRLSDGAIQRMVSNQPDPLPATLLQS